MGEPSLDPRNQGMIKDLEYSEGWWERLMLRGGLGTALPIAADGLEDNVLAPVTENEMPCAMAGM